MAVTGILSLGLLLPLSASAATSAPEPAPAQTANNEASQLRQVAFVAGRAIQHVATAAENVGDFLREQGIGLAAGDFVSPSREARIVAGMTVEYRPAVDVTLWAGGRRTIVRTSASSVDAFLREHHIPLGRRDRVSPSVTAPIEANTVIRVTHQSTWLAKVRETVAAPIVRRFDLSMPHGTSRVLASGRRGERELTIRYSETGTAAQRRMVLFSRVLRPPQPRVIAAGVGRFASFARVAQRGIDSTMRIANSALEMVASAYNGAGGFAANGSRAGFGVVAVDPAVIPLGTRLFIPGYGRAIAGDTGGAIRGHRIDLGFNSTAQAIQYGMRSIKVYVLR